MYADEIRFNSKRKTFDIQELNKWEIWDYVPYNETMQLSYWDEPVKTVRKILKRLRKEYPHYDFRSKISRNKYSYGVKSIECRKRW